MHGEMTPTSIVALYFVQMDRGGGNSKYGNAGAELGLGYCDTRCS